MLVANPTQEKKSQEKGKNTEIRKRKKRLAIACNL